MDFVTFEKGALKNIVIPGLSMGYAEAPLTTVDYAYSTVPWLYRGATLIAQAVSSIPYALEDVETGEPIEDDDLRIAPLHEWMKTLLYHTALSRTLYGAGYAITESNKFKLNVTPRPVPALCVNPVFANNGPDITSFSVALAGTSVALKPERVMWSWRTNPFSERAPGIAPAYVALQASGMLSALDQMATAYFKRGGVPVTAVIVSPATSKDDKEKLEGWLTKFAGGIRNAMRFLAIGQGTEFKQIGTNVKDTQAFELTGTQRDNVAVALGVPPTVLDGKSANYATANSEMMGFYLHTVIPEAEQIAEHWNKTFFSRFGLEMCIEEEKLEIMQSAQLEQAQSLAELAGGKAIFTVDEAREWLGMDPMTPEQYDAANPKPTLPPAFGQQAGSPAQPAASAGSPAQDAQPTEDRMKSWRSLALAMVKGGSPAIVGAPFDDELKAASSGRLVRDVFDKYWPKPHEVTLADAVAELRAFNRMAGVG